MTTAPLLEISDLAIEFRTHAGVVRAVDGVSYSLHAGETLAVVGESGSGKSVTAMAVLGLTQGQGGKITRGRIEFLGRDLLQMNAAEMRAVRGKEIAMIFQEPMTSLNPVFTVGNQIEEVVSLHRGLDDEAARSEAIRLLDLVGIPDPARRVDEYPHQLSGGMRQRVMIAMALSCDPKVLIADEPTTALDVTIQAQILELLGDLQARLGMAVLLITHDLGVVASLAHRVAVMYAGSIVESAPVQDLFAAPRHPYTLGLLNSLPNAASASRELQPIEGNVPDALSLPSGCRFHPRCAFREERCDESEPPLEQVRGTSSPTEGSATAASRSVACFVSSAAPDVELSALLERKRASVSPDAATSSAVSEQEPA
jgi:peptide/nickel transport system ATP-binding protein